MYTKINYKHELTKIKNSLQNSTRNINYNINIIKLRILLTLYK